MFNTRSLKIEKKRNSSFLSIIQLLWLIVCIFKYHMLIEEEISLVKKQIEISVIRK